MSDNIRKHVQILTVETKKSKNGKDYYVAQCIVHGENLRVGELMHFRPEPVLTPGDFIAQFDISVNYERLVQAELIALHSCDRNGVILKPLDTNAAVASKVAGSAAKAA